MTLGRKPVFSDFHAARHLIHVFRAEHETACARTLAFVVMPDHLHWLLELGAGVSLSRVVGRIKSVTAHRLGGGVWQPGFHDHALRKDEDLATTARYVVANPVRKGLVPNIGAYPPLGCTVVVM
ncbi:MAG: transposase [Sulfurimicrobium sp.]|nr:transposase [Sulfurimicrobium sp.]